MGLPHVNHLDTEREGTLKMLATATACQFLGYSALSINIRKL